jgi:hypothetical protein
MLSAAARGDPSRLVHMGASGDEAFGGQEGKDPHTFQTSQLRDLFVGKSR